MSHNIKWQHRENAKPTVHFRSYYKQSLVNNYAKTPYYDKIIIIMLTGIHYDSITSKSITQQPYKLNSQFSSRIQRLETNTAGLPKQHNVK